MIDRKEEIYYKNWLTWSWKLRGPTICLLQAAESGKPTVQFHESKDLSTRGANGIYKSQSEGEGLRTGRTAGVSPESEDPRNKGRRRWRSPAQEKRENSPILPGFVPLRSSRY